MKMQLANKESACEITIVDDVHTVVLVLMTKAIGLEARGISS